MKTLPIDVARCDGWLPDLPQRLDTAYNECRTCSRFRCVQLSNTPYSWIEPPDPKKYNLCPEYIE